MRNAALQDEPSRAETYRVPESWGPWAELDDAVVLVVDDGETNVLLLERLLRRAGVARVVGVTDPRSAVEQYLAASPDLVILDLHMPNLDGIGVLGALGAVIPSDSFTPVLVLTADATLEARQRALASGAHDFVNKPFEQSELLLRVKNLLGTRALHRTLQRHNAELEEEVRAHNEREARAAHEHAVRRQRIQQTIDDGAVSMVFQPIVDLATSRPVGVEALARFPGSPSRPPNEWFEEATEVGLAVELELVAVRQAIAALPALSPDAYLSVNVSPTTALEPALAAVLEPVADRIVVELTEHAAVDVYDDLLERLAMLRRAGVRVAIDDAGSGYASLRHILRVRPDIIKLDLDLTRGIDGDPARRALAAALVHFAHELGASITAEGVETELELEALRRLGVGCGQGYFLGRPEPAPGTSGCVRCA